MIASIFDIPTTTQIGTYVGTLIFTTCRKASAYQYLIDKIQKKIEGWQVKYLLLRAMSLKSNPPRPPSLSSQRKQPFSHKKLVGSWTSYILNFYGATWPTIDTLTQLVGKPSLLLKMREVWVLNLHAI